MTEFTIRITEMADRESIVSLWHEVFGDDEGYVRGFLDLLSSCGYTAAAFCGEELCSMTTVIRDLSMETAPCSYLYAVATRESYRGHHLASRVLDFCVENEQKNGRLVFTAPAEAGLFAWYDRTIGAEHIVSCRREHADYLPDAALLSIEKIDAEVDSTVSFDVLLVEDNGDVKVGTPVVEGVKVEGKVEAQTRGEKIIVFKYKAKKNEKKKIGHRQDYTKIQIEKIEA